MLNIDTLEVSSIAQTDPAFLLSSRFWTAKTLFRMGDEAYLLEMRDGVVADFRRDDSLEGADIVVSGALESWAKLLEPIPPPGFQDPFYNDGRADFRIAGDLVGTVTPYYHAVQEFVGILRRVVSGAKSADLLPEVDRDFDAAVGRYMYVRIEGVQYRIYYEEAGQGKIPLMLQHTAGADGRQWRHILEDPDYQKLYRIISYDLPFHGRSLPPTSQRWWEKPYRLTRSFLMETVIAISHKLDLDRPVFMGCSIGGMLAPDLAFYHPEEFRAVIAINGGLAMELANPIPGIDESFSSPKVGPQWKGALMRSNTAPTSPDAYRREVSWVYSQGAPTVLEGDVFYHMQGHDLTAAQAAQIDTTKVAVYLLTGEYDFLAVETGTVRLARAIKGSHYELLRGLGHFGPAENPDGFKVALTAVLEEIASAKKGFDTDAPRAR